VYVNKNTMYILTALYGECVTTATIRKTTNRPVTQDPLLSLYILAPCGVVILAVFIGCLCYSLKNKQTHGTDPGNFKYIILQKTRNAIFKYTLFFLKVKCYSYFH